MLLKWRFHTRLLAIMFSLLLSVIPSEIRILNVLKNMKLSDSIDQNTQIVYFSFLCSDALYYILSYNFRQSMVLPPSCKPACQQEPTDLKYRSVYLFQLHVWFLHLIELLLIKFQGLFNFIILFPKPNKFSIYVFRHYSPDVIKIVLYVNQCTTVAKY
jgi:hypothetical protein